MAESTTNGTRTRTRTATEQALAATLLFGVLLACGGKSKAFAAFDQHRLEYGKCEVIAQSKEPVEGNQPWLAASLCRLQHRKVVVGEIGKKAFDDNFDAWKKERGAQAIADARSQPASSSSTESSASNDVCPNGTGCMNRCRTECESKHGKMYDTDAVRQCSTSGGSADDCATRGRNASAISCFNDCRGL